MAVKNEQATGTGQTAKEKSRSTPVEDGAVPEIFMDDLRNFTVHNLVVRLNLTANYPRTDKPQMESRLVGRLVLPLHAFLALHEAFGKIIKELEDRKMIARTGGSSND
jgi:hypothetical protein